MNGATSLLAELTGDGLGLAVLFSVVLSVMLIIIAVASLVRARLDVRRRAAGSSTAIAISSTQRDRSGFDGVLKVIEAALSKPDAETRQRLRKQMIRAGYFSPNAIGRFLALRVVFAIGFAFLAVVGLNLLMPEAELTDVALYAGGAGLLGYFVPNKVISRRIKTRTNQVRDGFPDFMDLMVVCTEAGLSMEAAIDRVGRELMRPFPALGENLYATTLEIRAGRTSSDALNRLAERTGLPEAQSLATLLQQSEELGSSLAHSLRVYSDDMRNKRLMKAEEKAYALPAKLSIPLTMFIFPVLLITLMLPVIIRIGDNLID
ncbi:MAG: type II secretion system F family protein [Hyphomicrobiales bacterium]|nr:type II secretion system F family protein [Hyphomicrobiales bacterium]